MLSKTIKLLGIILLGAMFFASVPFTIYAYNASVTTVNATNITPMNATFNGVVNTGGLSGNAWFEYGTDLNFGNSTTLNAFIFNTGYGGSYSTNISGLTANTTYYFRAVAQNSQGRVYGNVVSFSTNFSTSGYNNSLSPTAITTSSDVLADNTAQFNSLILTGNSNKADTWFEWGTTSQLGNQTITVPVSGAPAIRHTNTITGLAPGTTYYFRAVAQNSYGISDGVVLSLVTSGKTATSTSSNIKNNTSNTGAPITSTDTTSVDKSTNTTPPSSLFSALGANAVGSGTFLPVNIFGWLILIILILLLVLLSKHVYGQWRKLKN
jgi:hypothetical protein